MRTIAPSHRVGQLLGVATICLFLAMTARADTALYSVDWVDANPPRIRVRIDTNPWSAGTMTPNATLSVTIVTEHQGTQTLSYDFLKGLQSPKYLKRGRVYERSFDLQIAGARSIASSSLQFPTLNGKADGADAELAPTAKTTDVLAKHAEGVMVAPPPSSVMSTELRIDRIGSDFKNERLPSAQKCSDLCLSARQCAAFTFVNDGQDGVCWLKNSVPRSSACSNCVSGVKKTMSREPGSNRNGGDFRSEPMPSAQQCSNTCLKTRQCVAFTFVGDDSQGGICWLKNEVRPSSECSNCVSGVKKDR